MTFWPRRLSLRVACAALVGCSACNQHLGEWVPDDGAFVDTSHLHDAGLERAPRQAGGTASNDDDALPLAPPLAPNPPPSAASGPICQQALADDTCMTSDGPVASEATAAAADQIAYFEGGAYLPAGKYRIAYVDGCMTFDIGVADVLGWTIHWTIDDASLGIGGCWLIADDTRLVRPTPGSTGVVPGMGAFATYDACVEANCTLPQQVFDFEGGRLGVRCGSGIPLFYLTGSVQGGRAPTFRLTRIAPCQ